MSNPWQLTTEEVLSQYDTDPNRGLSASRLEESKREHGLNKLEENDGINYGLILVHQIFNAMIIVLFASMVIALAIRDWISGGVIGAVVFINVAIGFWQEVKAEKTMQELLIMSSPTALVTRDGEKHTITTDDVVPGDIVHLTTGDMIPADVRLISVVNFATDEALLTGETVPISKVSDEVYDEDTGVGDRLNMAFSSSVVTRGRAVGVVVATGMHTEIGKIAASLKGKRSQNQSWYLYIRDWVGYFLGVTVGTPLQRKLSWLAITLFAVAVVFCLVVMGSQRMDVTREVAIYAICVAISMIPSALIVVLSITMAVGSKVMAKRHVIVRKLDSLEALGGIDAICSDKTGTLTQGKMVSKMVWVRDDGTYKPENGALSTTQMSPQLITKSSRPVQFTALKEYSSKLEEWLLTATLANTATLSKTEAGEWRGQGDPTELAIQILCAEAGWGRESVVESQGLEFVKEYPFDSSIKRMSTVYKMNDGSQKLFAKGAVERLLNLCILSDAEKADIQVNVTAMSSQGLRVLAFATKPITSEIEKGSGSDEDDGDDGERAKVESELFFQGLVGIYDPPRPETAVSVEKCHTAGISVHMLTGDHISTATAIAQEVGIVPAADYPRELVMSATVFDKMSEEEIDALESLPLVVARCSPQTKVRMIEALHRRNKFCAMTGDGVNDSPSLKMADVGIAMGQNGSDVAKNVSDIVLSDDNFASILNAVEEGRRMAANIQKFVLQLLAENIAQAIYLLVGLAFFDDNNFSVFPLSPIEVLWILVVTSLFPAMGLGLEKASKDVLEKPPNRRVFTTSVLIDMFVYGLLMAACCMATFCVVEFGRGDGQLGSNCNTDKGINCDLVFESRAATFATMTWSALILAWECVDPMDSIIYSRIWGNKLLVGSIIGGFASVFPIVYIPVINDYVFLHKGISWEWGPAVGFSLTYLLGSEVWKAGKRLRRFWINRKPTYDSEKQIKLSKAATFTSWTTGSSVFTEKK